MEKKADPADNDQIIHDFNSAKSKPEKSGKIKVVMESKKPPVLLFVILLILGVGTGFLVSKAVGSGGTVKMIGSDGKVISTTAQKGQIYGSKDEKTFKDNAQELKKETHRLFLFLSVKNIKNLFQLDLLMVYQFIIT